MGDLRTDHEPVGIVISGRAGLLWVRQEFLQDQARALDKFVAKPGEGTANAFEKARKAALAALDKLAGDDKEEEKKEGDQEEEKK